MSLVEKPRPRVTPAPKRAARYEQAQAEKKLYRAVWRWHFYAGMIVAPFVMVLAITGGLYIFKEELEPLIYPDLMTVAPTDSRIPYDRQIALVGEAMPEGFTVYTLVADDDPTRPTWMYGVANGEPREIYFDPYRGEMLGSLGPNSFFRVVLNIHRRLFIGTPGRIITELTTCWIIVLLATGIYLWWPRGSEKRWGVWLPRVRGLSYLTLRDLHAVGGLYAAVVVLLIASTGLLYTYVWGKGYQYAALKSGAYDVYLNPPISETPPGDEPLSVDQVVATAADAMPEMALTVRFPTKPAAAYVVMGSRPMGPTTDHLAIIDGVTGELIEHRPNREFSTLGWWATWNYPLHVGSVLGWWTKVPWLLACVMLTLLPVTGLWMWWKRRPTGTAGLPRRYRDASIPRWMLALIVLLSLVLPVVGVSLAIILACDWLWARLRRPAAPQIA